VFSPSKVNFRDLSTIRAMTGYHAVAERWSGGTFALVVLRDHDGHEVWGDEPLRAATPDDIPAAAEARLRGPVAWRVAGDWRRNGSQWTAPAELVDPEGQ
jgi:hypothetical protein